MSTYKSVNANGDVIYEVDLDGNVNVHTNKRIRVSAIDFDIPGIVTNGGFSKGKKAQFDLGIILKSGSGKRFLLQVNDSGQLITAPID